MLEKMHPVLTCTRPLGGSRCCVYTKNTLQSIGSFIHLGTKILVVVDGVNALKGPMLITISAAHALHTLAALPFVCCRLNTHLGLDRELTVKDHARNLAIDGTTALSGVGHMFPFWCFWIFDYLLRNEPDTSRLKEIGVLLWIFATHALAQGILDFMKLFQWISKDQTKLLSSTGICMHSVVLSILITIYCLSGLGNVQEGRKKDREISDLEKAAQPDEETKLLEKEGE